MSTQDPKTLIASHEEPKSRSREIIVINRSEKQRPSVLNWIEQLSRILAAIAIPIVLLFGSWLIQDALSERSVNKDYVALAVSILAKSDKEVDQGLRAWAVNLLNANSPVKFDPSTSQKLTTGEIQLPEIKLPVSSTQFRSISELPETDPLRTLAKSIGLLKINVDNRDEVCSAWLISDDYLITADYCVQGSPSKITLVMGFSKDDPTKATMYEVESKPLESNVMLGYAILKAGGKPGSKFGHLNPATRPVELNDQLFLAHYAEGLGESFSNQCRVTTVMPDNQSFLHNCDSAPGVSGAPLIRLSDLTVVGLHYGKAPAFPDLKFAKRIDAIRDASAIWKR